MHGSLFACFALPREKEHESERRTGRTSAAHPADLLLISRQENGESKGMQSAMTTAAAAVEAATKRDDRMSGSSVADAGNEVPLQQESRAVKQESSEWDNRESHQLS